MATGPSTVDLHGSAGATNGRITQTVHNPDNAGAAGNYQGLEGGWLMSWKLAVPQV